MDENQLINKQLELEERKIDTPFLQSQQRKEGESVLNKHLEATELLEHIGKLLMGYEYNSEQEAYIPIMVRIQQNGKILEVEQGPIMDPSYIRISMSYLKTFLNSNVFLSYIESQEQINAIMWDVNIKLTRLLHPLKNQYDKKTIEMTYAIIENSIFFAVNRSYKKNTLDAMTKMQHSIEHIGDKQQSKEESKKEFKIFGF